MAEQIRKRIPQTTSRQEEECQKTPAEAQHQEEVQAEIEEIRNDTSPEASIQRIDTVLAALGDLAIAA